MIEKRKKMLLTILASYIIGYLYIESFVIKHEYYEIVRIVFVIGIVIWVESLALERRKISKESLFWLLSMSVLSISPIIRNEGSMFGDTSNWIVGLFFCIMLHMIAVFYILSRFDYFIEGRVGGFFLLDWIYGFVVIPFGRYFMRIKILKNLLVKKEKKEKSKEDKDKGIMIVLVAFGTIFFLFMAIDLLSSADDRFASLMENIIDFSWLNFEFLFSLLLSVPVGAYLFGLVVGCCTKSIPTLEKEKAMVSIKKMSIVPNVVLSGALSLFCIIYGIYIYLQLEYFFGAITGELPQEFTFSEYARQGFFELCMVMALNLSLLFFVAKLSKQTIRKNNGSKTVATIFLIQSLLFAVTAFAKLIIYIEAYGFSALRLLSSWWVVCLSISVICAMASVWKPFKAVEKAIYISIASYVMVCLF